MVIKTKQKRILPIVISFIMVFSLFGLMPMDASASGPNATYTTGDEAQITGGATSVLGFYTTLEEALAKKDGQGIKIPDASPDYTRAGLTIPGGTQCSIDLNGKNIVLTGDLNLSDKSFLTIRGSGSLTVENIIMSDNSYILITAGSYVHVLNNVVSTNSDPDKYTVNVGKIGSMLEVEGDFTTSGLGPMVGDGGGGHATIHGNVVAYGKHGVLAYQEAVVLINGNVSAPNGIGVIASESIVNIKGEISASPKVQSDSKSTVNYKPTSAGNKVCEIIGGLQYTSLDDALIAVGNGQTIKLLSNTSFKSSLYLHNRKTFSIELNGKTIDMGNYGISVEDNTGMTIKKTSGGMLICGWIDAYDNATISLMFPFTTSNNYGNICASNNSTVNINGDVRIEKLKPDEDLAAIYAGNKGTVNINGNIFSNNIGVRVEDGGKATVNGIISAPKYIELNTELVKIADFIPVTTKEGYLTYSDGNGTVWVRVKVDINKASVTKIDDHVFDNKPKIPDVSIVHDGKTLLEGIDFTIKHVNNKNPGKASVVIKGINGYHSEKTVNFRILPKEQAKVKSAKSGKAKQLTVKWKKDPQVDGYQIAIGTNKKITKNKKTAIIKKNSSVKKTFKKLKKGKAYYVKIRAYKVIDGKRIYGAWSAVKKSGKIK